MSRSEKSLKKPLKQALQVIYSNFELADHQQELTTPSQFPPSSVAQTHPRYFNNGGYENQNNLETDPLPKQDDSDESFAIGDQYVSFLEEENIKLSDQVNYEQDELNILK